MFEHRDVGLVLRHLLLDGSKLKDLFLELVGLRLVLFYILQ